MWKLKLLVTVLYCVAMVAKGTLHKADSQLECKIRRHMTGCTSYFLENKNLVCHVMSHEQEAVTQDAPVQQEGDVQCTKVISGSSKNIHCGKADAITGLHDADIRLLIVSRVSKKNHIRLTALNVKTRKMTSYSLQDIRYVQDVAYMSSNKNLLIASRNKIISTSLSGSDVTVFKGSLACLSLAVDEARHLVFLGLFKSKSRINRLTTEGQEYSELCQLPSAIFAISIDSHNKKLFLGALKEVFYMSYDGKNITVLVENRRGIGLAFDLFENVLFYCHGKEIKKLSFSPVKTTKLVSVHSISIFKFVYHEDKMYIGDRVGRKPILCSLKSNVCKPMKEVKMLEFGYHLSLIK